MRPKTRRRWFRVFLKTKKCCFLLSSSNWWKDNRKSSPQSLSTTGKTTNTTRARAQKWTLRPGYRRSRMKKMHTFRITWLILAMRSIISTNWFPSRILKILMGKTRIQAQRGHAATFSSLTRSVLTRSKLTRRPKRETVQSWGRIWCLKTLLRSKRCWTSWKMRTRKFWRKWESTSIRACTPWWNTWMSSAGCSLSRIWTTTANPTKTKPRNKAKMRRKNLTVKWMRKT